MPGRTVLRFRDLGAHFSVFGNKGTFKPSSRGGGGTTENWKRFERSVNITDGGSAATPDVLLQFVAPHRLLLVAGFVVSIDGDITANANNYAQFYITNRGINGTGVLTAAYRYTNLVGLSQYVPSAMTVMNGTTQVIFERGAVATLTLAKIASGVEVNQCMVTVIFKAIEDS